MRRLTMLLCLFCLLPCLSQAEDFVTLPELRSQVGEGWHEAFTAMGREVTVQAAVDWFPCAGACPIVEVEGGVTAQPGPEFRKSGSASSSQTYVGWAWMQTNPWLNRSAGASFSPVCYTVYGGDAPPLIPPGLDVGYDALLAQIDSDLAPYASVRLADFRIEAVEVEGVRYAVEATLPDGTPVPGEPRTATGSYRLEAVQLLHGIPLVEGRETLSGGTPGGRLSYYYFGQGWRYYHLYCVREVAVLHGDVPLLSFDAMKQVWIGQIEDGRLRGIDGLAFGYLVCRIGERCVALPVWRLKGGYTDDPLQERVMPYHHARDTDGGLTVPLTYGDYYYSAQTGDMLPEPRSGVRTLPELTILTWEDVP